MSQVDEAVLDLTVSEASFLADVLGVAPPPGLVDPDEDAVVVFDDDELAPDAPISGSAVTKVAEVVAPGLIERRLVDDEGTVAAPVADMLTVTGSPHLVARVAREANGMVEVRAFTSRPEMAVEQRRLADGRVRFTPFDPSVLVDRIMMFVAADAPAPPTTSAEELTIEVSAVVIEALFAQAGDPAPAVAALVADGVAADAADTLVAAVAAVRSTSSVILLLRPTHDEIHGVELTWMDAGDHGLWLTEPSPNEGRRLLERVTVKELANRLISLLPRG